MNLSVYAGKKNINVCVCVCVCSQEYDELRRAAAEKQALELKQEAQAKYYTQVPKEELVEMQV